MKKLIATLSVLVILSIGFCAFSFFFGMPNWAVEAYQEYKAEGFVKSKLTDPKSAIFRNQKGPCGEVNSKNQFGGYVGFLKYVATSESAVTFENSPIFEAIWEFSCLMTDEQKALEISKINA